VHKLALSVIALSISLAGCSTLGPHGYDSFTHSANYQPADPMEIFGAKGKQFDGRLFRVTAAGNAYMSKAVVKGYALWAAGKAAFDNNFEEFAVLVEDGSMSKSLQTSGFATQYGFNASTSEINKFSVDLVVLLITEKDYELVNNIFKTSKYYTPDSSPN
jgi:hypothetical protein